MSASTGTIASNSISGSNVYLASNSFASNATSVDASAYSSAVYGWTLGGTTGSWTFHNGQGYLYATGATKLAIATNPSTKTWSISMATGNYATITFATTSYGSLQYNTAAPRFNVYTSAQASVYLYRYVDGGPKPTTITVTDNSDYKVTDSFDYNDFSVAITFSDASTLANVAYDPSMNDGFYFGSAYDPNDLEFDWAEPFDVAGDYAIEIYYVDATGSCNDIVIFHVKGGSQLGDTLIDLDASDGATSYNISTIYDTSAQLTVIATWANYGTEFINKGDGIDGYALYCATHDLTTPFTSGGSYIITISYRGLTTSVTINVAQGYETRTLNYNYENLQDRSVYYVDAMPSTGNPKVLVIPTKFTDTSLSSTQLANYKTKIEKAYFGTDSDTGWKSVRTYFEDSSYGQLSIGGKVTDWWSSGYASSAVTNETITTTLVKNAVAWYKANNSDITDYDTNGDGYIDAVSLIYGAPNYYNGGANDNLWAYCYWVQEPNLKNVNNPGPNIFFWASYDFMDEDTSPAPIDTHTYIHEMGHILGLDDYYNYDRSSNDGAAGGFIMQDYNVGDHDPYSKMALGWINPYLPTASTSITLRPFETSGDVIVLSPSFNNSPFDEYLVLDFYTATGLNYFDSHYQYGSSYPMGTTNKGIRVWHVDGRLFQTSTRTTSYSTSTTLTSSVLSSYYYTHAMSNSTGSTYGSPVSAYRNYRLLHLLQAGGTNTFKNGATFSGGDLWTAGMSFSMASYSSFFYNSGKLNSNLNLGWSFTVSSLTDSEATIMVTKL
jgi:M6 family metalloprotease-like protein